MAAEITDPRIAEIMARLNHTHPGDHKGAGADEKGAEVKVKEKAPPTTYEEFLKMEKLNEWPQRLTSETAFHMGDEKDVLGSKDDILNELREATQLDQSVIIDLENRLQSFEARINAMADRMVVDPETGEDGENVSQLPMSVNRAFLTEARENDVMKVHPSKKKKKSDFKDSVLESRTRSVDYCSFPGYRKSELTELPGQIEAPQILNRVTKAQSFSPGLKKFWKKIFQSEASVAMMQDAFWWFFIQNFETKRRDDQNRLFNRIADSFVALFTSVHPEIKDKIFTVYTDCLSQALFVAFKEAFPESDRHFQDDFKKQITTTTSEWVSGLPPAGSPWQQWDVERLQLRTNKPALPSSTSLANNVMDTAVLHKDVKPQTLDLSDFTKSIALLGQDTASQPPQTATKPTTAATQPPPTAATTLSGHPRLPAIAIEAATNPSIPEGGTEGALVPVKSVQGMVIMKPESEITLPKGPIESTKLGSGPEMLRVMFNLQGKSPLVTHFLHMRQLATNKRPGRKVRRTQIARESQETKTYRDLIKETTAVHNSMSKEYRKICHSTQSEIHKIERQQREATRRIEQLQKEITGCRTSMEIRLKSESIMENKDWDQGAFGTEQPNELQTLMKKDKEEE